MPGPGGGIVACMTSWSEGRCVYIPSFALRVVVQFLLDHADDDIIANQATLVHDLLGFPAEWRLLRNLRSKHIARSLEEKWQAHAPS
jgi:hypothetical protein